MTSTAASGMLAAMALRSIVLSLLAVVVVAACNSGGRGGGGGGGGLSCPVAEGVFRVSYIELSGDCGPVDASDVMAGGDWCTGVPAGCSGTRVCSADRCSIDLNIACDLPDGTSVETRGTTRAQTADQLRGTLTVTVYDAAGTLVCESEYDVTWLRR